MSRRIDNQGRRTRPHRCGRNCPEHSELAQYLRREIKRAGNSVPVPGIDILKRVRDGLKRLP